MPGLPLKSSQTPKQVQQAKVPGSGGAKYVYHLPEPRLEDLLGPSVLAWTLVAKLSELL
jgi:hypothetical protein